MADMYVPLSHPGNYELLTVIVKRRVPGAEKLLLKQLYTNVQLARTIVFRLHHVVRNEKIKFELDYVNVTKPQSYNKKVEFRQMDEADRPVKITTIY